MESIDLLVLRTARDWLAAGEAPDVAAATPMGQGQVLRMPRGASLTDFAEKIGTEPAALVTLLEREGVHAIERHLSPVEVNAPARVFGRHDLRRWLDGNLDDLRAWCTK